MKRPAMLQFDHILAAYGGIVVLSLFLPWLQPDTGIKLMLISLNGDAQREFLYFGTSIVILVISGVLGIGIGLRNSSQPSTQKDVFQKLLMLSSMGLSYFLVNFVSHWTRLSDIFNRVGLGFWISLLWCGAIFLLLLVVPLAKVARYIQARVKKLVAVAVRTVKDTPIQGQGNNGSSVPQIDGGTMHFSFMIEKIVNEGEDAAPFFRLNEDELGVIGVFDGLGGAGSAKFTNMNTGMQRSSAYWGSFYVSNAVRQHFEETVMLQKLNLDGINAQDFARTLKTHIQAYLSQKIAQLSIPETKLKGSGIRQLPTTLALIYFQKMPSRFDTLQSTQYINETAHQQIYSDGYLGYRYLVLWAGDSRCYVLRPSSGLHQLSMDDLRVPQDALQNLLEDSPMSNYVSFDSNFNLNVEQFIETSWKPEIIFVASDGCFAYFPTPMHFEFHLIDSLMYAESLQEWEQMLKQKLSDVAADDVSFALVVLGFGQDFKSLKREFARRFDNLKEHFIKPLNTYLQKVTSLKGELERVGQDVHVAERILEESRSSLWEQYRTEYERYLPVSHSSNFSFERRKPWGDPKETP